MENNVNLKQDLSPIISEKEFNEFLSASGDSQWRILIEHAKRNEDNLKKADETGLDGKKD